MSTNQSGEVSREAGNAGDPAVKQFVAGTHRLVAPRETLERIRGAFGVVGITRIATVTGLDCIGLPVVAVYRPNARSLAVSQGKGVDLDAARASGAMEAIELYHAERALPALKLAPWRDFRRVVETVDVDALPRMATSTFHPNLSLLWTESVELNTGARVWVPYELVHANYELPLPTGSGAFLMSTNGLASGNHVLEAICHGLCETIERDAVTLFCIAPPEEQDRARIDLTTVDDPVCRGVLECYERAGVAVAAWDATSDVGVPTFLAAVIDAEANPFRPIGAVEGMGCHPVREVALLRALTEAAQARLTLIAGARDDNGRGVYRQVRAAGKASEGRARIARKGQRRFADVPSAMHDTLEADLRWLLGRLTAASLSQVLVVDLGKPELRLPIAVVRVIVPGLETYHLVGDCLMGPRARRRLEALR
jgi:ribosomal protein S12 methylthiotransferase accessory factor